MNEISSSLEAGIPVLAQVKNSDESPFRVLIGCQDGGVIMAEPADIGSCP